MLNYYFLAFVDILGFSEMVRSDCHSGNAGLKFLPLISSALNETRKLENSENQKLIQFSDSIIISQKFCREKDTFLEFVNTVGNLQRMLFNRGILCRGGIAHGKHSEENDIIFSQALVEAYRIESSMAQYPRVVVSEDLLQLFEAKGLPLITDKDGLTFVDFLRPEEPDTIAISLGVLEKSLSKPTSSVMAKIRWIADYCQIKNSNIVSSVFQDVVVH